MAAHHPITDQQTGPGQPATSGFAQGKLLLLDDGKPFFVRLFSNIKDALAASKQPPLQVTFRPMSVKELLE